MEDFYKKYLNEIETIRSPTDPQLILAKKDDININVRKCLSPDGNLLAIAYTDITIRLYDTDTGKEVYRINFDPNTKFVETMQFSPDGKSIVVAQVDQQKKGSIVFYDIKTGNPGKVINCHPDIFPIGSSMVISPDGKYVFGSNLGGLLMWEVNTGSIVRGWFYLIDPSIKKHVLDNKWKKNAITNIIDRTSMSHLGAAWVHCKNSTISPDSRVIALSHHYSYMEGSQFKQAAKIELIDIMTGDSIWVIDLKNWWTGVSSIDFSPDGKILAVGGPYKLKFLEVASGEEIFDIKKNRH
ncbi:MAG: WD40 repeat domain-containing protein [Candidatus Helarchaeota archaeon]